MSLAVIAAFAPSANASRGPSTAAHSGTSASHAKTTAKTCYSQMDNDNGVGIVSQDFEPSLDAYDNEGVDDFSLKKKCAIKTVTVAGVYFNGSGPATSIHAGGYRCKNGGPFGKTVYEVDNLSYTDSSGTGNFTVKLNPVFKVKKTPCLFFGVVAMMDFSGGGEWGWNTNNTQRGNPSYWENPGDGFGTGCTDYTPTLTCIPSGEGPDFAFQLN